MILSKEQILAAKDAKAINVPVAEWGQDAEVRMKAFSGADREAYLSQLQSKQGKNGEVDIRGLTCKLLALTIVDENDELIFTEADIEALNKKNANVLTRLFEQALKLNALDAAAPETARKN